MKRTMEGMIRSIAKGNDVEISDEKSVCSNGLLFAITDLAIEINSRPEDNPIILPPAVWKKYYRVLEEAGVDPEIDPYGE